MTSATATLEKVKAAVARMEERQEAVTLDALREEVGGGSKGTLIKLLAAVRAENKQTEDDAERLSADTRRAALEMALAISRSERGLAEEKNSAERQQCRETIERMVLDAQRAGDLQDETDEKLAQATARLHEVEAKLAAKNHECDQLWTQIRQGAETIKGLERRVAEAEAARPSDPMLDEIATLMRGLSKRLEPAE